MMGLVSLKKRLRGRKEIFGPVACVIRVRDYDEALVAANDTPLGLTSGICTTSLKYATDFRRQAQAGMVMVNLPTAGVAQSMCRRPRQATTGSRSSDGF